MALLLIWVPSRRRRRHTIKQRLATTRQLLNVGGPDEFAKSIDEQRAQVAAFAKELGIAELPQN
ncbi:MAG: hypothetical protein ACLQF4_14995 [Xanthobacteraceae bacterium]